jgi:hypothetical protein
MAYTFKDDDDDDDELYIYICDTNMRGMNTNAL